MIKSMTGYGAANYDTQGLTINVEVKTLNSKFLDLNIRLPKAFSQHELSVRNKVSDILQRGKVSITIEYSESSDPASVQFYNEELFKQYYTELKKLTQSVGLQDESEIFKVALGAPDVINSKGNEDSGGENWAQVEACINEALTSCDSFREKEGAQLMAKFQEYIQSISGSLHEIEQLDPKRIEKIRERIEGNLKAFVEEEIVDKNRLEQEMIYYIEKLDITEEKVRLKNHLTLFTEVLNAPQSMGKKLGFIAQELGREINTIGSKANDSDIQHHVIQMKEELEKIKEQMLNVI